MVLTTKWKPDYTKEDPWEDVPEDYTGYVPPGHPRVPTTPVVPKVKPISPVGTDEVPNAEIPRVEPNQETEQPTVTPTKEYATQEHFNLLRKFQLEGTLGQKQLTRPLWLTNQQAKELGYDVKEGQDFLLSPEITDETTYGRIPEPTISTQLPATKEPIVDPIVTIFKNIYLDKFTADVDEQTIINQLSQQATEDPAGFLLDLQTRGRSADTIQLLQLFSAEPLSQDTIDSFFQGAPEMTPEQQLLMKALPMLVKPKTMEWATKYFGNSPDKLRRELITAGRNENTEALVRSKFPNISEQGLKDYFSEDVRPSAPMITTPAGKKVAYPMTDKEWASMSQRERTFYKEHPQEWLADRDNWAKLRVIDDRIRIVAETLGIDVDADTPPEKVMNFVNMALWVLPIPLGKLAKPLYQAGKKLLPAAAKESLTVAERFLGRIASIKIGGKGEIKVSPKVVEEVKTIAQEPLPEAPKLEIKPEIPKEGKIIPTTEVKPPMVEPTTPITGKAANIRLSKFNEDVRPIIKDWADKNPVLVQDARRGVISDAQVRQKAEQLMSEVGGDLDKLRAEWTPGTAWTAEEITAIRGALAEKTKIVLDAQKLVSKDASPENLLKLELAIREQAVVQELVHGLTAEAGRALRSFRQSFAEVGTDAAKMEALLKRIGRENLEGISERLGALDINDPTAVNRFIQSLSKPRIGDYLTEIYYNSILSGPKTHIVNAMSNTFNAIFSPIERTASALVDLPLSAIQGRARQRFFNEVPTDVFGAIKGIPEGFRQFAYVIKNGISYEQATKWEFQRKAFKGKAGAVITMPSRFLQGADELFHAINTRAAINAEAHRLASIEKLTGQAFEARVAELLSNPTAEMLGSAEKIAEYRLFRQPLGKTGQSLMAARESVDILGFKPGRFLVPFIRTPMNLVKYGLERTPLGLGNPKLWNSLATKNPEAADQLARAIIGSVGVASMAWYAKEGKITGAPPRSPAERERFYREGKQPFAIRVGEFWISYQRLEPFNQLLSQVSILVDAIQNNDKGIDEKITDALNTFGQNFVSQTYMSSISDLLNMLAEPERYGGNWLNRFATAMVVPMSSASRTATQMLDDIVRDPQNTLETIEANIPGLSKRVQAKITSLGEDVKRKSPPWFPINVTPVEETILSQELERLHVNIGMASTTIKGVKLSESEQVEYQKLVGGAVKTDLEKLMLAPDYWKASDIEKNKMIDSVITKARDRASSKMREKMFVTGTTEERVATITTALKTADSQLGKVLSATPEFSHEPPNIYDVAHELDSSYRTMLEGIPESSLKDAPPTVHSWYEKEKNLITKKSLSNKSLAQLNADPKEGDTYKDYFKQWQERSQITDEKELADFDKKYPNAKYGNFTRRQLDLLNRYYSLSATEQRDFIDKNPELSLNPQRDWLLSHPKENALLSLWGEGKLLTKESYDEYNKMVKELDLVDSVLPDVLPDKLPIFLLKTERTFRDITAKIETARLITDEKLRDETIDKLRQTKIGDLTYKDIERKIEALSLGTDEIPTPDIMVNAWVERGQTIDKFSANSAEAKLWLIDHPDIYKWALDNELLTDAGTDWNIPVLRINAQFRKQDEEYDALPTAGTTRQDYLKANPEYATAVIQRNGYNLGLKDVTQWQEYYELPEYGFWRERYRKDNPEFDASVRGLQGKDAWMELEPEKIPNVVYDEIYEKYKDLFDSPEPSKLFEQNPAFKEAYYRRAGYGLLLSDNNVQDYVTYMLMPEKGWGKERYLKLHPEFFLEIQKIKEAKDKSPWMRDIKWDEIPSQKVEELFFVYDKIVSRKEKQDFREQHPDLDEWLVLTGKVSKTIAETKRISSISEREKFLEGQRGRQSEFEKKMAELRKKLGGL